MFAPPYATDRLLAFTYLISFDRSSVAPVVKRWENDLTAQQRRLLSVRNADYGSDEGLTARHNACIDCIIDFYLLLINGCPLSNICRTNFQYDHVSVTSPVSE